MRSSCAGVVTALLLVSGKLCLLAALAAAPQSTAPRAPARKAIVGTVVWGKTFEKGFGHNLILRVELLGAANDAQNGMYISILNTANPKNHQLVLLPDVTSGSESNFVGVFVTNDMNPKDVSKRLVGVLERYRNPLSLTYITAQLGESELERIEAANVTLGHHGRPEEEYARARAVLDRVKQTTGLFKVLDYKLREGSQQRMPHISDLKFSFDPGGS